MLRLHPQYRVFESQLGLGTTLPVDVSIDLTGKTFVLLGRHGGLTSWSAIEHNIRVAFCQSPATNPIVVADRTNWQNELATAMTSGNSSIETIALPRHPKDKDGIIYSKFHALVHHTPGGVKIRPINGVNGVYINNQRLKLGNWHLLSNGEVVSFASIKPNVYAAMRSGTLSGDFTQGVYATQKECFELAYTYVFQSDPNAPPPVPHAIGAHLRVSAGRKRKTPVVSCLSDDDEEEEGKPKKKSKTVEDEDMAIVVQSPRKEEPAAAAASSTTKKVDDDDLLPCSICLETVVKPHMLTCCSNNLCHLCIVQHFKSGKTQCPMCRAAFTLGKTEHFNRQLSEMIDKQVQHWTEERRKQRMALEQRYADEVARLTNAYTHVMETTTTKRMCSSCCKMAPIGVTIVKPCSGIDRSICLVCYVKQPIPNARLGNKVDANTDARMYTLDLVNRAYHLPPPPRPFSSTTSTAADLLGQPNTRPDEVMRAAKPECPQCHSTERVHPSFIGDLHLCRRCDRVF